MQGLHLTQEEQLIDLILSISEREREIEISRQKLSENAKAEPYALFLRFQVNQKEAITAKKMKAFLESNGHVVPEELCQLVMNHYGTNKDHELEFQDFLSLVLPTLDSSLRANTVLRQNYNPGDRLDEEIELQLTNLLLK